MRRAMMLMIAGREMTRENITLRKPLATCHCNSHLSITWSGCLSPQLAPIYYLVRLPVTATHTYYLSPQLTSIYHRVRPPVITTCQATCHHSSHLSITWSGHLSPQFSPIYYRVRPPVTTTHTYLSPGLRVKEEEEFNHKLQATSGRLGQGWKRINHINLQASSSLLGQ